MTACMEVLRSFSLSKTGTSVDDSLMHQQVAAEDALEMAQLLDAEMQSVE